MSELRKDEYKYKDWVKIVLDESFTGFPSRLIESTVKQDMEDVADYIYTSDGVEYPIAFRVRNNSSLSFCDLTLRNMTQTTRSSEVDKIINGKGSHGYYFYAWESKDGSEIVEYMVVKINTIRKWLLKGNYSIVENGDVSNFINIHPLSIRDGVIAYSGETIERIMKTPKIDLEVLRKRHYKNN